MGYKHVNLYYLYTAKVLNIKDYRIYEKILSNPKIYNLLSDNTKFLIPAPKVESIVWVMSMSVYFLTINLLTNGFGTSGEHSK